MIVLGIILIVLGLIAIGAGIIGGIVTMFRDLLQTTRPFGLPEPTEFLKALTGFLKALVSAPVWMALIFIGVLLVIIGARLTT